MREWRTFEEGIVDKALYLSLLDLVAHQIDKGGTIVGNKIKCMKLPFLVEYPMFEKRSKVFNLTFFQYEYGPFSKHIYEVWGDLEGVGCLSFVKKNWIELEDEGHQIAHAFINEVLNKTENQVFLEQLQDVARKYGRLAPPAIMNVVYNMEVYALDLGRKLKVQDAPMGTNLIYTLDDNEAKSKLKVDQSWLETLAIALTPANKRSVVQAIEDFHQGRVLTHEEVWSNVS